jgi:hypothetical protein
MESERERAREAAAQDIARAEFRKRRKRLGMLTAEQESAIEALLISTVNNISRLVAQMRRPNEESVFSLTEHSRS